MKGIAVGGESLSISVVVEASLILLLLPPQPRNFWNKYMANGTPNRYAYMKVIALKMLSTSALKSASPTEEEEEEEELEEEDHLFRFEVTATMKVSTMAFQNGPYASKA
tara:strand:- start:73 stop:399 length:327 start_codon:yes stop_codon:yes gene_type:complete